VPPASFKTGWAQPKSGGTQKFNGGRLGLGLGIEGSGLGLAILRLHYKFDVQPVAVINVLRASTEID